MKTDLRTLPFSCRGSYMVLSELPANWNGQENEDGLYLRTVHSSAMTPMVACLHIRQNNQPVSCGAEIRDAPSQARHRTAVCHAGKPDRRLHRPHRGRDPRG